MTAPPTVHAPLSALPVVVLDVESTGLDPEHDRVVQVGAVAMLGETVLEAPRIDRLVNPGVAISPVSTDIHGIDDDAVAGAEPFAAVVPALEAILASRVVVGHHVGFDLAILRHEAARAGRPWADPPALDVAMLTGALAPTLRDLGLETIAAHLGVTVKGRHTALGDCLTTAAVYARLLGRLREAGVRTLGEAHAFAARRSDLEIAEMQARWAGTTAGAPAAIPELETYVYARRVAGLMSAPPAFIAPAADARTAAREMVERRLGALLVGEAGHPPAGIVTERDLLRVAAGEGGGLEAPVTTVMSAPVATVGVEELLYRALGRMDRLGIRHLCVVDVTGVPVGMVSQRDLLQYRARSAAVLGDAVAVAPDVVALATAHGRVTGVAEALVSEGLPGHRVARVISSELRALTARAAELAAVALEAEGHGPAPTPWCMLVLGSGGRGESLLSADQDNALIHAGSASDDGWFAALGERAADLLDSAGVPRCKGGVMAATPAWRGTLAQWRERVDEWLRRARPEDLLNVDIFFDLTPVTGDAALARTLHADAVAAAGATSAFIGLLAQSVLNVAPRFGLFGRLRLEDDGRMDLKRDGLLPLVSLARTLALRAGSSATTTPQRLHDAAAAGRLPERDADALAALHADLLGHVLVQQLADAQAGRPPSSRVEPGRLARPARARLLEGLHRLDVVLRELRGAVSR
jgi:DNA polymerase-3 subunit epsilon/CBS domain-containing protein